MRRRTIAYIILVLFVITFIAGLYSEVSRDSGYDSDDIQLNSTDNNSNSSNSGNSSNYSTNRTQTLDDSVNGKNITGTCTKVIDGDTIDVEGVGRIRLVGVNTPERNESGYQNATDFVKEQCLGKEVTVDVDDQKHYDKYNRTLAVVYVNGSNLNQELLQKHYAEVMYIPPSEFDPYSWQ